MKLLALICTLVFGVISGAFGASEPLDVKAFFEQRDGAYRILSVNGEVPKSENAIADVAAEAVEGVLTLPYCPPGGFCDPGYLFFEYADTEGTSEVFLGGPTRYTLWLKSSPKVRYTWEEGPGGIEFTNPDYEIDGKQQELVHALEKKASR